MSINQLLSKNRMCFCANAINKDEAIEELIDLLDRDGNLYDRAAFKTAVLKREAEFSTGIGMGIAIPHGKDKSVKMPAVAFALSQKGIDFKAKDGTLAHLLFLIAVPDNSDDMHLKTLITISRKLMHEDVRIRLMNSQSYEDVVGVFDE